LQTLEENAKTKLIRSTQRNVTWQNSSEYRRLTVPSGRTLNYVSFVRKIQIPEIFGSPLVNKNTEAKNIVLEVNGDKMKCMVRSRHQNAQKNRNMKTENKAFVKVEQLKNVGNQTNQNYIQEECKSSLNSGDACYHSVQKLLSSSFLTKNINIKIFNIICQLCCIGVKLYQILEEKKTIRLFTHSRNYCTCIQNLERKWRDNFNDAIESTL